jgi:hypothetical protein
MRTQLAILIVIAGAFATSGAYAADTIVPVGIDWDQWSDWLREAAGSLPG